MLNRITVEVDSVAEAQLRTASHLMQDSAEVVFAGPNGEVALAISRPCYLMPPADVDIGRLTTEWLEPIEGWALERELADAPVVASIRVSRYVGRWLGVVDSERYYRWRSPWGMAALGVSAMRNDNGRGWDPLFLRVYGETLAPVPAYGEASLFGHKIGFRQAELPFRGELQLPPADYRRLAKLPAVPDAKPAARPQFESAELEHLRRLRDEKIREAEIFGAAVRLPFGETRVTLLEVPWLTKGRFRLESSYLDPGMKLRLQRIAENPTVDVFGETYKLEVEAAE